MHKNTFMMMGQKLKDKLPSNQTSSHAAAGSSSVDTDVSRVHVA